MRVRETLAEAAIGEGPAERLTSMGRAHAEMLADREPLLSQMHRYAACADPEIRGVAREGFHWLREEVARLSGARGRQLQDFFVRGMPLNLAASMDCAALGDGAGW